MPRLDHALTLTIRGYGPKQQPMKIKTRAARAVSAAKRARTVAIARFDRAAAVARPMVPLKERRLVFGNKWDYAPAPEAFEYIKIPPRHELFINGKFVPPHSGKYFESLNPATEE